MGNKDNKLEKIISLAKRRGFIFPSSEIYGGFRSSYDYGPYGVLLKNNIKKAWWYEMVQKSDDIVGLDSAILMSPKIWEASGHTTSGFADLLAECRVCKRRFRFDHTDGKCPECDVELTEPKKFNLLVKTNLGPVEDQSTLAYFRPETAQGIYVNFKNVLESSRMRIPFGIAQIGKAFRNEITPGPFTYRMREFEQMEMQFFIKPGENKKWFDFWKEKRMKWYVNLGIKKEHLRFMEHKKDELAHYARAALDIEYKYPWGWGELEGIHDRGDWDLGNHSKFSGKDLSYFDDQKGEKYIPNIIETSGGIDRAALVFLLEAYDEEEIGEKVKSKKKKGKNEEEKGKMERDENNIRRVLRFHPKIAPIKSAVFPLLSNNEKMASKAKEIYNLLKPHFMVQYDQIGSIGRRYRRQDEIGTPYCITIDHQTLEDETVTIRDRDTLKQERVEIGQLIEKIKYTVE